MPFGVSEALNLELIIQATDATTDVLKTIGEGLKGLVDLTAGFQTETTQIQNNTTLTAGAIDQMKTAILAMNAESGAPLAQLGAGFMHISNLGFSTADSIKILDASMKSAVSTGSNTADVANVLALQMHDFGIGANDAAHAMDVLHLAAASGNATLEQFVESTSKSVTMAANLKVPLTEVDAALAALSRHMDLDQANTTLAGAFNEIVHPSQAAIAEMEKLRQITGVNLPADFTAGGLAAKGLTGIMADLDKATGGNETTLLRLIPAMRGGLAAMVLTGTGAKDYADIIGKLGDAYTGKLTPTQEAYARELGTFNGQLAIVKGQFQQFAMVVGQPIMSVLQTDMKNLLEYLDTHKTEVKQWATDVGQALAGAVGVVSLAIPKVFGLVGTAWEGMKKKVDDAGTFFSNLGTGINHAAATVVAGIMTIWVEFEDLQARLYNKLISGLEAFAQKLYELSNHNFGLAPTAHFDRATEQTPAQMKYEVAHYVESLFGYQGPFHGAGGGVGPGGMTSAEEAAADVAANGGIKPPQERTRTKAADSGGSGNGSGTGDNGGSSNANGAIDLTALATALSNARDQFSLDQLNKASHAILVGDIDRIVAAMRGEGDSPIKIALEQARDLKAIAANTKATSDALTPARDQFALDQLNGASRGTLLGDIQHILDAMKAGGASPVQIALEQAQDLKTIAQHTKATALATTFNLSGLFATNQQAGYGSTIAAFGSPQRTEQEQTNAHLRQMLANDEQQIAELKQQNALLLQQLRADNATAGNTGAIATELAGVTMYRDPRAAKALKTSR